MTRREEKNEMCRHLFRAVFKCRLCVQCTYAPRYATLPYIYRLWFFLFFFWFLHSSFFSLVQRSETHTHTLEYEIWTYVVNARALSERNHSPIIIIIIIYMKHFMWFGYPYCHWLRRWLIYTGSIRAPMCCVRRYRHRLGLTFLSSTMHTEDGWYTIIMW